MLERTLFFYLLKRNLLLFFIVTLSFLVVYVLGQVAELSRSGIGDSQGFLNLLMIALFRAPILMQPSLPYVIFLSTSISVSRMVRSAEFAIVAQLGVHPLRSLSPFTATGLLVGVLYVLAVHPLSSLGYQYAENQVTLTQAAKKPAAKAGVSRELVVSDAEKTVYILLRRVAPAGTELIGTTFFHLDAHHRFLERYDANKVIWTPQGWRALDQEFLPQEQLRLPPVYESAMSRIAPEMLRVKFGDRYGYSIYELPRIISFSNLVGAKTQLYSSQFYGLLALPILLACVAFLSASFLVRPLPSRKFVRDAMLVMAVSWVVYILSSVSDALAIRGVYPPLLLAGVLPLVLLVVGLVVIGIKGVRIPSHG